MSGRLYCVGVGPGDPELMTVKAVRVLSEADVLAYPHSDRDGTEAVALGIALAACKESEGKERIPVYVPMTRDRAALEESLREAAYYGADAIPDDAGYFTTVIVRRKQGG